MSADIIASLQIDKKFENARLIVVKEKNNCDSSFIGSCVIGHCIKNKEALLVVNLHNSWKHYQHVGLRINYNLQKYMAIGLIDVYHLAELNVTKLLNNEPISIEGIYKEIEEKVLLMRQKYTNINILIDGVSHLFDLQFNLQQVNKFCADIFKLIRSCNNSFAVMHCNVANDEDITNTMANILAHKAYTVALVETLPSGWSTDVSGHLTFMYPGRKFEEHYTHIIDMKPSLYLFKLFDKGVKLLAPGTV